MAFALTGRPNNTSEQMKTTDKKMATKLMLQRALIIKLKAVGLLALAIIASSGANAAVIVSDAFSFGYTKANASTALWTLQQPSTDTTLGDFSFTPTVSGTQFSSGGPTFPDRTLTTPASGSFTGNSAGTFFANLNFSYTGTPVDAAPLPNYKISLIIDSISIWGVKFNTASFPGNTLAFSETTAGHTATSSSITLNNVSPSSFDNLNDAANYLQLVWNPVDYAIDGTSGLRSFGLVSESGRPIDGFEVFGRVELTYDAIPEPSTVALGIVGLAGVLFFRKRKQLL